MRLGGARDAVERVLTDRGGPFCDDCLAELAGLTTRQGARAVCLVLEAEGRAFREPDACGRCSKRKTITRTIEIVGLPASGDAPAPIVVEEVDIPTPTIVVEARDWHWEGHVQDALVRHLREEGYSIRVVADTASRAQGIDIVAERGGRELWVSVKGYPRVTARTHPATQARHYFAGALLDMAMYRGESPGVDLAMAFPHGFKTFHGLAERTAVARDALGYGIYWIHQGGRVDLAR